MNELLTAFTLGNAAILTNVCMLPLYPGLIAFLAGTADKQRGSIRWLGFVVLLGILSLMILLGAVLYALQSNFANVLPLVLPIVYALVIILGLLMIFGRNPFKRLTTLQTPVVNHPAAGAYVYGLLLGPMTLPCTGPVILSAFVLGAAGGGSLASELAYFIAFGLGFGWPLVLLPFLAAPLQRNFTRWAASNVMVLNRVSGLLLVAIGLFGVYTELLPLIV